MIDKNGVLYENQKILEFRTKKRCHIRLNKTVSFMANKNGVI